MMTIIIIQLDFGKKLFRKKIYILDFEWQNQWMQQFCLILQLHLLVGLEQL